MSKKSRIYTYEEDLIVLDETITTKEKDKLLGRITSHRLNNLRSMDITPEKLKEEKQLIIDVYPDVSIDDIALYLNCKYPYIKDRVKELRGKGLIREEKLLTEEYKEVILKNRTRLSWDRIAKMVGVNINLVKIIIDRHGRKRQLKIDKKLNKKLEKLEFADYMQPPSDALDKKEIQKIKYRKGKTYEITTRISKKSEETFIGKLIGEYENYILLRDKKSRKETFMKVDFMTGQARIKEVAI